VFSCRPKRLLFKYVPLSNHGKGKTAAKAKRNRFMRHFASAHPTKPPQKQKETASCGTSPMLTLQNC